MTIKPKHRPNSIRSALICVAALFGLAALLTTPYIISKFATATNTSAPIVDNDGVLAYGDSTYGGGAYAVLGCYNGAGGLTNTCPADINIPSTWNGHDVVEIADQAFEDKSGVDKLTTNNGLRYVGASAFADSAFTELSFASTVETYGSQAFFRMAHVKGVQLTINFANPSPAPATFGNDIMGWTWDGGLGTNLVINIPPTPAAWQAYLNASQSSDSANWQRVMTNAYTPPFPTVVVMNGSRGWCTPAQFGTTCYDNDGALPNIELYQSGTPVSPPPSVSDVNGNILAYSSLANGTYQIYGNSIDSGVELVVSGGQNSSAIVNFGPQLAVSAGAPLGNPINFGTVSGIPYSVAPVTVRLTNVSSFGTARNVNINTSWTCGYYGSYCTDISGNVGDLAPGAYIDFQVFPKTTLSYGAYGTPTGGEEVAYIGADGASSFSIYAALTILNPYRVAVTGQDGRLSFQYGNTYELNLGAFPASNTDTTYALRIYNDGELPTGDMEYYCYPPSWNYINLTLGGSDCTTLYSTPATISSIPVGGYYDLTLSTPAGISVGSQIGLIYLYNSDLGVTTVDVRQRVVGNHGVSVTSDVAHPSFAYGVNYHFADDYDGYDPDNIKLPLVITNIGTQPTGDMSVYCDVIFDDCGSWSYPTGTIPGLAVGDSTTIYISPRAGLLPGDYSVNLGLRSSNWGDYDYTQSYGFRVLSCANDACLGVEVNDSDDPEILLPDLMEGFAAGDGATLVKITNTGHLPISNLMLSLPSGDFVLSGANGCVNLASAASCQFTITPTAGLIRGQYTGQLSISYGIFQIKLRDIVLTVTPFAPPTPPVIPGAPSVPIVPGAPNTGRR